MRVHGVLVAGGLGTRMGEAGRAKPKPMLEVAGRPLLARQLDLLAAEGIGEITVCTGYLAARVEQELRALAPSGLRLSFKVDPFPAGSGGCLAHADLPRDRPSLVLFGDVAAAFEVRPLLSFHGRSRATATAAVHPNDHPLDSDLVEVTPDGRIAALHRKPHPPGLRVRNLVVAGLYVLGPEAIASIPLDRKADLAHDVLAGEVARGRAAAYRTSEYLKDMGTPERWAEVTEDFRLGRPQARLRSCPRPTAFLDRDGTLVREAGHVSDPDRLELLPGVARAVRRLNRAGVLAIVLTNQPVVARGECTLKGLERIHARLDELLGREGAFLDGLYFCPHHPDRGFAGEVATLKVDCSCRKPRTGLAEAALRDFAIDLARAAVFGDGSRDLGLARALKLPCYLVGAAHEVPADDPAPRSPGLAEAVERWLGERGLG